MERIRVKAQQEAEVRMAEAAARRRGDEDQEEDGEPGAAGARKPVEKESRREPVSAGRS